MKYGETGLLKRSCPLSQSSARLIGVSTPLSSRLEGDAAILAALNSERPVPHIGLDYSTFQKNVVEFRSRLPRSCERVDGDARGLGSKRYRSLRETVVKKCVGGWKERRIGDTKWKEKRGAMWVLIRSSSSRLSHIEPRVSTASLASLRLAAYHAQRCFAPCPSRPSFFFTSVFVL